MSSTEPTETPRTDALFSTMQIQGGGSLKQWNGNADFARTLERDLIAARQRIAELEGENDRIKSEFGPEILATRIEAQSLRKSLAAADAGKSILDRLAKAEQELATLRAADCYCNFSKAELDEQRVHAVREADSLRAQVTRLEEGVVSLFAREWTRELGLHDMTDEQHDALSEIDIIRGVEANYKGGLEQFRKEVLRHVNLRSDHVLSHATEQPASEKQCDACKCELAQSEQDDALDTGFQECQDCGLKRRAAQPASVPKSLADGLADAINVKPLTEKEEAMIHHARDMHVAASEEVGS